MKRDKNVSFTLTQTEYEQLSVEVAKRIATERQYVTISTYVREIVVSHLNGNKSVSPPEVDTDSEQLPISTNESKQKKSWGEFNLDGMYDDS
jgi:stress response protein YsnF